MKLPFLLLASLVLAAGPPPVSAADDKPDQAEPKPEASEAKAKPDAQPEAPGKAEPESKPGPDDKARGSGTKPAPRDHPRSKRGGNRDNDRAKHEERRLRPDRERPHRRPEPRAEKTVWLGVAPAPVPEVLRTHLDLDEGFGVLVREVVEDSPAAEAGLRAGDVLVLFDDQKLTTPDHLSLLVRSQESGDEVVLTLIRKGREEKIDAILGETERILRRALHSYGSGEDGYGFHPGPGTPPFSPYRGTRKWDEAAREIQDQWKEWNDRPAPSFNRERKRDRDGEQDGNAGKNKRDDGDGEPEREKEEAEAKAEAGRPPALSVRSGFPLRILGMRGVVKIDNEEGELTIISEEDGDRRIAIQDKGGNVVYEGPFDAEEGVSDLPEPAREQLEKMKLEDLDLLVPGQPRPKPESEDSDEDTSEPVSARKKGSEKL